MERDYIGWSGVLLLLYTLKQRPRACMRMCTCSNAGKPDLEIIASTINRLVMYIKTHGSVSCGPRSRRVTPVSIGGGKGGGLGG